MTDHQDSGAGDEDMDRIETLLRENTPADAELVELPVDLWARIETEVNATGDETKVVVLDRRKRFRSRMVAIGTVAATFVIVAGLALVAQRDDDGATVIAGAELTYDPATFDELGASASARVSLVDDGGALHLEIDESDLPSPSGQSADLELWLIQPDSEGNPAEIVSLGLIDPAESGDFVVPAAYDPDVYFVVDISVEPRDGNADHSGRSILRGPLTDI